MVLVTESLASFFMEHSRVCCIFFYKTLSKSVTKSTKQGFPSGFTNESLPYVELKGPLIKFKGLLF